MFSFLPCLFVFLINATPITSMDMIYKMNIMENEESSQSDCGRNITLPLDDYKHEVVSYGYVGGDCSVNFVLNISSTCPCKICMRKVEWELNADVMNITFTGESEKKILKFPQGKIDEICFEGRTLNIHVVENKEYSPKNKDKPPSYRYKFALNPNCSRNPDEFMSKLSTTSPVIEQSFTPITMTYYLENVGTPEGKCGRNWTLPINGKYQYALVSNGRAVNGDCTTTVVVGASSKCNRKICVRLDEWILDADIMNVTLTGENATKVLRYGNETMNKTCFQGIRLEIRVVEKEEYYIKWENNRSSSNTYSFKFVLFPDCPGFPEGLVEASDKDSADFNKAAEITMNNVYGGIVAFLICSVFLVVLLVSYCYYKIYPQDRKRK